MDAGPRSKLPRSGDLMDGDRRVGEKAGGRVRRQTWARPQQQAGGQWVSTDLCLELELELYSSRGKAGAQASKASN